MAEASDAVVPLGSVDVGDSRRHWLHSLPQALISEYTKATMWAQERLTSLAEKGSIMAARRIIERSFFNIAGLHQKPLIVGLLSLRMAKRLRLSCASALASVGVGGRHCHS